MWTYYGSKTNVVGRYPRPIHDVVIEPFAGTARYALKYFEKQIILVDKYPVIVGIWKYLQQCSPEDIKRLPHFFKGGEKLDDFHFDCQEERNLIGFLIGFGMQAPRKSASVKRMTDRPNHVNFSLNKIEKSLFKIKHWDVRLGSYEDIENVEATWFIDPPYQFGGEHYVHSSKKIDFNNLSEWCRTRQGQVMVCESAKANWMDFVPLGNHKGAAGMQKEVIWTNTPTQFNNLQQQLIF